MSKLSSLKPLKCLLSTLFFMTLVFIFISAIFRQRIVSNYELHDPQSLHHQISYLQTQVGILLKQIHSEQNESATLSSFSDQVIHVAVLLDKLAQSFSSMHGNTRIIKTETYHNNDALTVYEDLSDQGETENEGGLIQSKEVLHYTRPKPNRLPDGKKNFLDLDAINPALGLGCTQMTADLDRYSTYKRYTSCPDDWELAQKLILKGCDPLPRRICFSRNTPRYDKPLSLDTSLWTQPNDSNILWNHYKCKNYNCLVSIETLNKRGFHKCSDCFNLSKIGWEIPLNGSESADISINEVLALKKGEIRVGLDFSPTTGTFAALMRERNVTIVSATLNLGAPFNEVIALRGLIPLYVSIGMRLPFFDSTLDLVHTTLYLDGWIDLELLEYVLFDWDRVLRPKGVLWVDRFFCKKEDMEAYINVFEKLGYTKIIWKVVAKKDKVDDELYLSAEMAEEDALFAFQHECGNYRIPWMSNIWLRMHQVRSSLFTQHKMNMDDAIQVSCIIDKLSPSWKDFKPTLKNKKEELTLVELGSHLRIKESLRYNDNKGKSKHHDNTRAGPNKKAKPTCWKYGKTGHIKRDCKCVNVGSKTNGSGTSGSGNGSVPLKGQNMFKKYLQVYYVTMYLKLTLCRMVMLHGGLTHEQQLMCVKIDSGSRPMSQ
nr:putative S-adenosyl-L-methionine-dependent methyltransferase [Tanacetum cinerariifolium]